jgi:hypothetical protein
MEMLYYYYLCKRVTPRSGNGERIGPQMEMKKVHGKSHLGAPHSQKNLYSRKGEEKRVHILLALSMFWSVLAFAEIIFDAFCHAMHRCMRSKNDSHPGAASNSKRRIVHGCLH